MLQLLTIFTSRRWLVPPKAVSTLSQKSETRTKVRLSHKSETVSLFCETVAENGEIRRQSHFSATVSLL